jgi:hypothetical protein
MSATTPNQRAARSRWIRVFALLTLLNLSAALDLPAADKPVDFARDIRPILAQRCEKCHGPDKQKGGLRLDLKTSAFHGGDSGEKGIVPGHAGQSRLFQLVTSTKEDERMPPSKDGGGPLSAIELGLLRRWIDAGAQWEETAEAAAKPVSSEMRVTDDDRRHWSFRPLQSVVPPRAQDTAWARTSVDQFIRHAQEAKGVTPSPSADTRTLVRRIFFDLIGLPPTPEEMARWSSRFTAEGRERSVAALVDALLADPRYGERWARHWLDVARYADSNGQESDHDRPNAYRFRDFVIRALNEDLPFNQFVSWQLAGDEMAPDNPDAIAATGFIVAGISTILDVPMAEEKLRLRADELDDMVSTTGQALLGLTLACARCHDHKYDPIPSRDYYRLMRAFNGGDRTDVPLASQSEVKAHRARMEAWQRDYDLVVQDRERWKEVVRMEKIEQLPVADDKKRLLKEKPEDPEAKFLATRFKSLLNVSSADSAAALPRGKEHLWDQVEDRVRAVASRKPAALPSAFAFADFAPEPRETWFFERGNYMARNEKMDLGFLTVLTNGKSAGEYWSAARTSKLRDDSTQQRRALADWITDLDHGAGPLMARVMVNRVWQHHFGEGLVRTVSDFGTRGELPTHPELLDWLTGEFVRSGWSLKHLHRLMMLSNTYQQSASISDLGLRIADSNTAPSKPKPSGARQIAKGDPKGEAGRPSQSEIRNPKSVDPTSIDPENRLLWRRRPLRLESEALRDSMLAMAGTLNTAMFGPSFKPPIAAEAMQARNVKDPYPTDARDSSATRRRSLYMFHKRVVQYPLMQAFDAPEAQTSCGRRMNTTVAPQALALLNDPFVRQRADELATRLQSGAGSEIDKLVRGAFQLCLSRDPSPGELADASAFIRDQSAVRRERDPQLPPAKALHLALTDFCQSLFGLNEFIYID